MSQNIISANLPVLAKQKSLDHDCGFVEVLGDSHKKDWTLVSVLSWCKNKVEAVISLMSRKLSKAFYENICGDFRLRKTFS